GTNAFHQLPGAFDRVTGQVDHDIRIELPDTVAELARGFGFCAVDRDLLNTLPGVVRSVGLADLPADVENGMARLHQSRHKEGADMTGATDDNNAQRAQTGCAAVRSIASICFVACSTCFPQMLY